MKRIRVPETRIKEVANKLWPAMDMIEVRAVCNAFAESLSEHPQVPTDEQLRQIFETQNYGVSRLAWKEYFAEWQRRCFVQEEPEIPEEIRDLLDLYGGEVGKSLNFAVQEAYRRGLRKRGE